MLFNPPKSPMRYRYYYLHLNRLDSIETVNKFQGHPAVKWWNQVCRTPDSIP